MKKQVIIISVVAVALLGCLLSLLHNFKTPDESMSPPSLSGEDKKIEEAFRGSIKTRDYTLEYPSEGANRTAFVKANLDGDPQEEVIVFYTLKSQENSVRINILDSKDGKWHSLLDEDGYGSQIDSVEFDDLNGDGVPEILFVWSTFDSGNTRVLTVHSAHEHDSSMTLTTLVNEPLSFMKTADMDNDGIDEILTVTSSSSSHKANATANLLKMNSSGTIKPYGSSVSLDGNVSSYAALNIQKSGDHAVALLDAYKGSSSMITEAILWNANLNFLEAPFTNEDTLANTMTLRSTPVPSMDIDGDGEYEIPIEVDTGSDTQPAESEDSIPTTRIPQTCWSDVVVNSMGAITLVPKAYSYVNTADRYMFNVSQSLRSNVSVYRSESTGVVTVYGSYNSIVQGDPMFSLVIKPAGSLGDSDTYSFKKQYGSKVIYGTITSAGQKLGFTDELIENSIVFY